MIQERFSGEAFSGVSSAASRQTDGSAIVHENGGYLLMVLGALVFLTTNNEQRQTGTETLSELYVPLVRVLVGFRGN